MSDGDMSDEVKQYLDPGKKNIVVVYVLYLFGIIIPILPMIGAVFAFANKTNKSELLGTHYIFAFRSFAFAFLGYIVIIIFQFSFIGQILKILIFTWFIVRSILALQYLLENKSHPNPLTFGIK